MYLKFGTELYLRYFKLLKFPLKNYGNYKITKTVNHSKITYTNKNKIYSQKYFLMSEDL